MDDIINLESMSIDDKRKFALSLLKKSKSDYYVDYEDRKLREERYRRFDRR